MLKNYRDGLRVLAFSIRFSRTRSRYQIVILMLLLYSIVRICQGVYRRIEKITQKYPSMETAPSGQMIRIIVIQLTRTSFQPLFSLSIFSIILLTFRCCLLYLYYTLYRQFVKGFCRFFSKFFIFVVSRYSVRVYVQRGPPRRS